MIVLRMGATWWLSEELFRLTTRRSVIWNLVGLRAFLCGLNLDFYSEWWVKSHWLQLRKCKYNLKMNVKSGLWKSLWCFDISFFIQNDQSTQSYWIMKVLISCGDALIWQWLYLISALHLTLRVKSTRRALISSVTFTPPSGLAWVSLRDLKSQQISSFNLICASEVVSPSRCPSPCALLINIASRPVLICASVCCQVATFNNTGRKIKWHLLATKSARKSRSAFRNTVQRSSKYD